MNVKNWKQNAFFGLVAIIALGFGFIGCDDKGEVEVIDYPKDQSQIITLTFETESPTATVKGHLTNTQWIGVATKVKTAINEAFKASGNATKNKFRDVFGRENVKIIVGKRPDGKTWETVGDSITLYINIDAINKADFQQKIVDAVTSMDDGGTEIN